MIIEIEPTTTITMCDHIGCERPLNHPSVDADGTGHASVAQPEDIRRKVQVVYVEISRVVEVEVEGDYNEMITLWEAYDLIKDDQDLHEVFPTNPNECVDATWDVVRPGSFMDGWVREPIEDEEDQS